MIIIQNRKIKKYINQLARTENFFLVIAEPGCGKKTIVKEIHKKSIRKDHQVVFLNCSSLVNSTHGTDVYNKFEEVQNGMLCLENFDETLVEH